MTRLIHNIAMPIIEFRRVNKWYGSHHVLTDVDLAVEEGEVVVVIGPSGSGKSTLVRCINRLETVADGELIVDGVHVEDPKTDIRKVREEVGMVFQQFNLYPNMTVLENITLAPIQVRKISRDQAEKTATELLARVGIGEKAAMRPRQLSGGSSSGSRSRAPWRCHRRSCCSTSRPAPSTPK